MQANSEVITITTAVVGDAEELLTLQKLAYQSEAELYHDFTLPPLMETLEQMRLELNRQTVLKAVTHGRIVGSVRGLDKDGSVLVGRLIVHPDFRRRGLGTRLMEELENRFPQAKCFRLFTGHISEVPLSIYKKLGYREIRRERQHEHLTLVYMEKSQEH